MRQYRGLTKDGKQVYGWYAEVEGKHFIITESAGLRYHECPDGIHGIVEVIPKTVGQQIGLKDKNKKEIYEGDIIALAEDRYGGKEIPIDCVVKWNDKGFYQLWRNGIIHWKIWKEDSYGGVGYRKNWEIIGNIHQNPKLIKEN